MNPKPPVQGSLYYCLIPADNGIHTGLYSAIEDGFQKIELCLVHYDIDSQIGMGTVLTAEGNHPGYIIGTEISRPLTHVEYTGPEIYGICTGIQRGSQGHLFPGGS